MAVTPHTLVLEPGQSRRHNAGSFDVKTNRPAYDIQILVPHHVRHQVALEQFLIRTGDGHLWIWDIKNGSSWPAIITVTRDGVVMTSPNAPD